eukprot:g71868.t1
MHILACSRSLVHSQGLRPEAKQRLLRTSQVRTRAFRAAAAGPNTANIGCKNRPLKYNTFIVVVLMD